MLAVIGLTIIVVIGIVFLMGQPTVPMLYNNTTVYVPDSGVEENETNNTTGYTVPEIPEIPTEDPTTPETPDDGSGDGSEWCVIGAQPTTMGAGNFGTVDGLVMFEGKEYCHTSGVSGSSPFEWYIDQEQKDCRLIVYTDGAPFEAPMQPAVCAAIILNP